MSQYCLFYQCRNNAKTILRPHSELSTKAAEKNEVVLVPQRDEEAERPPETALRGLARMSWDTV